MNSTAEPVEINKDLRRWSPKMWIAATLLVLALQAILLLKTPRPLKIAPLEPPQSPTIKFARSDLAGSELVQLQDPSLFAGANERGFSGAAWLREEPWAAPPEPGAPSPLFLEFSPPSPTPPAAPELPALSPGRPLWPDPRPAAVPVPDSAPPAVSRLSVEDLPRRQLLSQPAAPIQFATDALRPTVIEVLIDLDGSVFSARILEGSGFKPADADGLRLSRQLRFAPVSGARNIGQMDTAKVTFDWFATDPSQTNAPARRP
jgi:hypothetical protein